MRREQSYRLMVCQLIVGTAFIVLAFALVRPGAAFQTEQTGGATYVVQPGDSLWSIAERFHVELDELQNLNGLADPSLLSAGIELLIPGLEGYTGQVDTREVTYGENLLSLSQRYQAPVETLINLNRLFSPAELYVGRTLILPAEKVDVPAGRRVSLAPGETLLELAVRLNTNPWSLASGSVPAHAWSGLPGEVFRISGSDSEGPGALPEVIQQVELRPGLPVQGKTLVMNVKAPPGLSLRGWLGSNEFSFFPTDEGYAGLQGLHTLTEPGVYHLVIEGRLPSGSQDLGDGFSFSQPVLIGPETYIFDPGLEVDPDTLDPAVTGPEEELWAELAEPVTPQKLWDGPFQSPVPVQFQDCWTSRFGNRRSYNGSAYDYFHGGLDFCGREGTELYAVAAGRVAYTGKLVVRGNVAIIDHGLGVYTAYAHLSEILVEPGELVAPGQIIGLGGSTGRSTGPHLHWEVWVGGVQVDPVDWLEAAFP